MCYVVLNIEVNTKSIMVEVTIHFFLHRSTCTPGGNEELMRGFVSRAERFASLQKFSAGTDRSHRVTQ